MAEILKGDFSKGKLIDVSVKSLWDEETYLCFVLNLAYNVDFCVVQFYSYIVCWVSG